MRPNTCSKTSHAFSGSHMCGIVESIYVRMPPDDDSASFVLPESWIIKDCNPTTKSREISAAKSNDRLLGANLEAS